MYLWMILYIKCINFVRMPSAIYITILHTADTKAW
jgi:hypothetical protein